VWQVTCIYRAGKVWNLVSGKEMRGCIEVFPLVCLMDVLIPRAIDDTESDIGETKGRHALCDCI
jgi:hypothetical protein